MYKPITLLQSRVTRIALALLLCVMCIPVQALGGIQQAYGADFAFCYAVIYKKGTEYTLVFQNDTKEDKYYGTMQTSYSVNTDGFRFANDVDDKYSYSITKVTSKKNVTAYSLRDLSRAFSSLYYLKTVDLSRFDTPNLENMSSMFSHCFRLETVDLTGLDTSNVTDMSSMFEGCTGLKSANLSGLHVGSVEKTSSMFKNCKKLQSIDLTAFNLKEFRNGYGYDTPLEGCDSLTTVTVRVDPLPAYYPANAILGSIALPRCNQSVIPDATGHWVDDSGKCYGTYFNPKKAGTYVLHAERKPCANHSTTTQNTASNSYTSTSDSSTSASNSHSLAKASITVKSRAFSGKKMTPASVVVKLNGKTLAKNTDYTVSCKGGKAVGSYTVTIAGKGSYTGSKSATFKIVPKAVSGAKAKGAKRALKITWKKPSKAARAQVTGYQIRYSTAKSMKGAKTVKVKGSSKTSATAKKLKADKTYYVQVRVYKTVKGKTYYSSWSAVKSTKTKK